MDMTIRGGGPCRAYTLLEILVVVTLLGIAGALVVPAMSETDSLRVQSALRAVVSDLTFAQSDALAYQRRRAVVFDVENNRYLLLEVNGAELDPENDVMFDPDRPGQRYIVDLNDPRFAGATITAANFDGDGTVIFDEMGGPVQTPTGETPATTGTVGISGSGRQFVVSVEAYTGRVTVNEVSPGG